METIVVGVDGSSWSTSALRWAGGLAGQVDATLVAVNAFGVPYAEVSPNEHARLLQDRRAALDGWTAPVTATGTRLETVVIEGDPRDVVGSFAADRDADLLVVGRTGAGGSPGPMHLGSVAEHAAHHVDLPLAVVPVGWAGPIGQIAVGVDGSAASQAAVHFVADVAPALGAFVHAVHVERSAIEPITDRVESERRIQRWASPLTDSKLTVFPVLQQGIHPADGLVGFAKAQPTDLLVVGMRGLGGFSGLRIGGVALKVLHRASMPLVLVPRSGRWHSD